MSHALNLNDFFIEIPAKFQGLLDDFQRPWAVVEQISELVKGLNNKIGASTLYRQSLVEKGLININIEHEEICVLESFRTTETLFIKESNLLIEAKTLLEKGALLRGNSYIGSFSEIRQGAYLRGNVIVGDRCVVGHCTEIKNSMMLHHVEAGHFNYIGDSLLGSYINLGAGTVLANLEFRSYNDKIHDRFPPIKLPGKLSDNRSVGKFGAIIGDGSETGCNSVLAPGAFLGKESIIYPNVFVPKGIYPPSSTLRRDSHQTPS